VELATALALDLPCRKDPATPWARVTFIASPHIRGLRPEQAAACLWQWLSGCPSSKAGVRAVEQDGPTTRWRYICWYLWDGLKGIPRWHELYDHQHDDGLPFDDDSEAANLFLWQLKLVGLVFRWARISPCGVYFFVM
jgi:hypothetical protein